MQIATVSNSENFLPLSTLVLHVDISGRLCRNGSDTRAIGALREWGREGDSPVEKIQVKNLTRDRQHQLRRVHAQCDTSLSTLLRDALGGKCACTGPGKVDHENSLVVLAEDGERNVPGLWIVEDLVLVLVDLLQ